MTKQDVVDLILQEADSSTSDYASAYAPANIALCKYWGKRNTELNLPVTSSLSVSLGEKGTHMALSRAEADRLILNGEELAPDAPPMRRLTAFLNLFRGSETTGFLVESRNTIPTAAGLASSASAFASLVRALDGLFGWELDGRSLSILARLGSGSASRSLYDGFVEWHVGAAEDGMDSFAEPLPNDWPELRLGVVTVSQEPKPVGSREAMQRTVESCDLYASWPIKVANDLIQIKEAIREQDFLRLGEAAESNALAMHATMIATWPPVLYWLPGSVDVMQRVWALREQGMALYFTMDAGPNVKLLFEAKNELEITRAFPDVECIAPFTR